ncbi:hypothetical protein CMI37_00960 [Candidatus Pacearchaeota archaeon]|nr:hypothetical protein [Candidatus Pacearchaeota archaeon]
MSIFGETKPAYTNPDCDPEDPESDCSDLNSRMSGPGEPINAVPTNSGVFHTMVPMKNLLFKMAPNSSVIEHMGSYITFGTDRPGVIGSGTGGQGYADSATIDIVVGRGASARAGKGLKKDTLAQPMFSADAARIYVSQMTNLDKNFGIAAGVPGSLPSKPVQGAGIGIKADDVRLIARNSMKIISGRGSGFTGTGTTFGEPNSKGGKSQGAPTIQLIAGNYSDSKLLYGGLKNPLEEVAYLQPAIKGHNMIAALKEMNTNIQKVWSAVYNMALIQAGYNGVLAVDPYRPSVPTAFVPAGLGTATFVMANLWATRIRIRMWEQYYLEHHGYRYIASPNIWLT